MHVAFYAEQLYYLPQYTPVIRRLLDGGHRVSTVVRLDAPLRAVRLSTLEGLPAGHEVIRVPDSRAAYETLRSLSPDWAVFGSFRDPAQTLPPATRTALVYHGIGVKSVLFDPRLNDFDLRCVESQRVLDELLARDPGASDRCAIVGFAKLDPLFSRPPGPPDDAAPPVVLYAPTFYPSSLELMPERLCDLVPATRWLVKPHFFTWTVPDYAAQRRRLERWAGEPGVEVLGPESYDLVPLMARADVLVSDASSALFEFAALGRPVVWCRFLKLRWAYRGLLSWRYKKRMDPNTARYEIVARCVDRAADLPAALSAAIEERRHPPAGGMPEDVDRLIEHLIGPRDGRASQRIVEELERRSAAPASPPAAVTSPGGSPR